MKIDFSALEAAIETLEEAVFRPPRNELERDGVIQRFEYTFELCWKFIRRVLQNLGRKELGNSPKPLLRAAFEEHFMDDIEAWFGFLEVRNATSHIYDKRKAEKVYKMAITFPPYARKLLMTLKNKNR